MWPIPDKRMIRQVVLSLAGPPCERKRRFLGPNFPRSVTLRAALGRGEAFQYSGLWRPLMKPSPDFVPALAAKKLLRESRSGALATLMPGSGDPYCSLVNVATASDGAPLLLISRLAVHTKNILADSRVSLMLDERVAGDPLEGARIMVAGRAEELSGEDAAEDRAVARRRYLAVHPSAEAFVDFKDFAFFRIAPSGLHLVAGFGRIVDLKPAQSLTDLSDAADLLEAEGSAVEHMNEDHREAMNLYATKLLGAEAADWRCTGCDPEGMDMQAEGRTLRLEFPERVRTGTELRKILVRLAADARARQ